MLIGCHCEALGWRFGLSWDECQELLQTKGTCTDPRWVCGTVDKILRQADVERQRRKQYTKRLKRAGHTDNEISKRISRKRSLQPAQKVTEVNLDEFVL